MAVICWIILASRAVVPVPHPDQNLWIVSCKGNCCREPAVKKARDHFPEDLNKSNPPEVPLPSWN